MPDPLEPTRCAELLGALADPARLRIVRTLRDGSLNVSDLAERLQEKLVNVSHHLSVLRHAGLVQSRKQGRHVLYSLTPGVLQLDDTSGCCDHLNLGCCRLELPVPKPTRGKRRAPQGP
jgi:DNA-binding transcriptional ArsR family regulator